LDDIGDTGNNLVITGLEVQDQSVPDMTVQVSAGSATVDGISVSKTSTTNTGTITAPTNSRYDVVVINSSNSIVVVAGPDSTTPTLPSIAVTQRPLALIKLTSATATITDPIITDISTQGCYVGDRWIFDIQSAVDYLNDRANASGGGKIIVNPGEYYEEVDLSGLSDISLIGSGDDCKIYRPNATDSCIKSVNSAGSETTGLRISGFKLFGNGYAGAISAIDFDYTDEFIIKNVRSDGNASSTATGRDIDINECDDFILTDNIFPSSNINRAFEHRVVDFSNSVFINQYKPVSIFQEFAGTTIAGTPIGTVLTAVSNDRIAYIDAVNNDLRTYEYKGDRDGWTQIGVDLNISGIGNVKLAAMSATRVAFIDGTNQDLRAYDSSSGTFSLTGNELNISGANDSGICALSSTRIALIDSGINVLRAYDFDGTNWTLTGNSFSLTNLLAEITTLGANKVAVYYFSGSEKIETYSFDGTDWTKVGNTFTPPVGADSMASLTENTIVTFIGAHFRLYEFDGQDWSAGLVYELTGAGSGGCATMSSSRIVSIDDTNDKLEVYNVTYGFNKLPTPPFN
jgi:hypothetical protein